MSWKSVRSGRAKYCGSCGQPRHRLLALRQHGAPVLEARRLIDVRVDQVLDRAVDRSRVLIHAGLVDARRGLPSDRVSLPQITLSAAVSEAARACPSASLPGLAACYKLGHDRCPYRGNMSRRARRRQPALTRAPFMRRPRLAQAAGRLRLALVNARENASSTRGEGSRSGTSRARRRRSRPRVRACSARARRPASRPSTLGTDTSTIVQPFLPCAARREPAASVDRRGADDVTLPPVAVTIVVAVADVAASTAIADCGARDGDRGESSDPEPRARGLGRPVRRRGGAAPGSRRPHSRQYSWPAATRLAAARAARSRRSASRVRAGAIVDRARGRSSGRSARPSGSGRRRCRSPAAGGGAACTLEERVDLARRAPRSRRARRSARRRASR